jgi:hypothetical protein
VRQHSDRRLTFWRRDGVALAAAPTLPIPIVHGQWVPDDIPVWDGTPFDVAYAIDVLYAPSVVGGA